MFISNAIVIPLFLFINVIKGETFTFHNEFVAKINGSSFIVENNGMRTLSGKLGFDSNDKYKNCAGLNNCIEIDDYTRRYINVVDENTVTVSWISTNVSKQLKDCYALEDFYWFGGPERWRQLWPLNKMNFSNYAYVMKEDDFGAIGEPYWLTSGGGYILVSQETPLFVDQNDKEVCFIAKLEPPYTRRDKVVLRYNVGFAPNVREAHLHAVRNFFGKPTGTPNRRMIERPIWSTWARYKRDINDSIVRSFAQEIAANGYSDGQFEIDDDWEICYGALEFRQSKFAEINKTVAEIKRLGFRVTLWVHPFINSNCEPYATMAKENNFLVKNENGSLLTQWWNSNRGEAYYLDFTNPIVRDWFRYRLLLLQENHGIDSFKFDAGESSWPPQPPILNGDINNSPNVIVSDYARTCAKLGDLVEVRTGWKTQDLPVFVRMIDKDSRWGSDNGLYTLITTLLQMNINGYSFVLPDMIGGNGYNDTPPSAELFVRWLQANTFMPAIQFSYVPWDYRNFKEFDVMAISKKFVDLHANVSRIIFEEMNHCVRTGHPLNPPIWWIAPNDERALREDTEFLVGERILVAPVIEEGARSRKVYLPKGIWLDGNSNKIYYGPIELDYNAPIDILPYFYRSS